MRFFQFIATIYFGIMILFAFILAFIRVVYTYSIGFIWDTSRDLHNDFLKWSVNNLKR